MVTMLHGLKLAISNRAGARAIIDTDQRVKEADKILTDLQRWFPKLQAAIDENEKTWAKLGYNMCTISKTAQEILEEDNTMHYTLHSLYGAGESVLKPLGSDALSDERSRSNAELRSFNDNVRTLRGLQQECVAALRNKDYYTTKVESIRTNENRKKNRMTDRENERRLRNEEKLNDYTMEANFKADKLQVELEKVVSRKQHVLECAVGCYVRTQDMFFGRNPMSPVATLLAHSPRRVQDTRLGGRARRMATFHGVVPREAAPPRARSPVVRVASAGPRVSYGGPDAERRGRRGADGVAEAAAGAVAAGVAAGVIADMSFRDGGGGGESGDSDERDRPAAYPVATAL